jgi:predicted GNAT family acetyltransferase
MAKEDFPYRIEHETLGAKGAFFIRQDGKRLGALTYSRSPSVTILDHTEVSDALRGTGAGRRLVAEAVRWARAEGIKLLPLCPFAKSVFDKTPEYADVLKS